MPRETINVHEAQSYVLHRPVAEGLVGQPQTSHIAVGPAWDIRCP